MTESEAANYLFSTLPDAGKRSLALEELTAYQTRALNLRVDILSSAVIPRKKARRMSKKIDEVVDDLANTYDETRLEGTKKETNKQRKTPLPIHGAVAVHEYRRISENTKEENEK
jgi:hypothetical protein